MEHFQNIIELIRTYGYWVVGIGIFMECMGIPFPGETVLILGGVAASLGHLNLAVVIIIASASAVLGDNMGYFVGRKLGRKILKKLEKFPFYKPKHIESAEKFFKEHGNKTVFIGRFTAILRTYAALFAGIFDMPYPSFFVYNFCGGVLWATLFGFVGFLIGNNLPLIGKIISDFNLLFLIILVIIIGWFAGKYWLKKVQLSRDAALHKSHQGPENVMEIRERRIFKNPTHKTAGPIMHPGTAKRPGPIMNSAPITHPAPKPNQD
jgi:membrane protein DedA with SNARE-associated domain